MHRVVDKLFLTDQATVETAGGTIPCVSDDENIDSTSIGLVISIGCRPTYSDALRHCERLTFPQFTDEPSTCLLPLWRELVPLIDRYRLVLCRAVVVHCVYGQSRSVSSLAAYLCATASDTDRRTLQAAVDHLNTVKPSISVNPGFLSQLFVFNELWRLLRECRQDQERDDKELVNIVNIFNLFELEFKDFSVEKNVAFRDLRDRIRNENSLAEHTAAPPLDEKREALAEDEFTNAKEVKKPRLMEFISSQEQCSVRSFICKKCKCELCPSNLVISSSIDSEVFVKENSDEFWRNFGVSKAVLQNKLPLAGYVAVLPQPWMREAIEDNSQGKKGKGDDSLPCPQCQQIIGSCRKGGNYFGPYTIANMYLISTGHVALGKRK